MGINTRLCPARSDWNFQRHGKSEAGRSRRIGPPCGASIADLETGAHAARIALDGDLGADGPAQGDDVVVDDALENLHAFAPLAEHAGLVKGVQVLRHVGLRGVDFTQQFAHVFLAVAKAADDPQPHRRGHHAKQLGCQFEHLVGFGDGRRIHNGFALDHA